MSEPINVTTAAALLRESGRLGVPVAGEDAARISAALDAFLAALDDDDTLMPVYEMGTRTYTVGYSRLHLRNLLAKLPVADVAQTS